MRRSRQKAIWLPLGFLLVVHLGVLGAEWIAPYGPGDQHRTLPLAPPTRVHFFDAEGRFHPRPFVYRAVARPGRLNEYVEDRGETFPLRFFGRRLVGVDDDAHVFLAGTDRLGRDLFSRLLYGGRTSLGAGLLAGLVAVGLGLVVGTAAGYAGGRLDALLMRFGELVTAFPALFLLVGVRAALPLALDAGLSFLVTVMVLGLLAWVPPARLVRGIVLSAKERDFVLAARGFGASGPYLLRRHVLWETWPAVSTHLALVVPGLVLAEVTLSFLGLGVAEPGTSWGLLLADLENYEILLSHGWMSLPAVALTGVIIGYHRLAHVLRRRGAAAVP